MRLRNRVACCWMAFLFLVGTAWSQSLPASQPLATKQDSVPADSLIQDPLFWGRDKSELLNFIHEDIGDLLSFIPGGYTIDRGRIGQLSTASVRGSSSAEAVVLLGDRPLADPFDGRFDLTALPVVPIRSVGIYRPGAFLPFGQTAVGGAVGLRLMSHRGPEPFSLVRVRDGYYGYNDVEVRYSQRVYEKATIALGGGLRDVAGFRALRRGGIEQFPGHNGENWYIDLRGAPLRRWQARYTVVHTRNDADVPSVQLPEGIVGQERHRKEVRTDHTVLLRRTGSPASVSALVYGSTLMREFRDRPLGVFVVHKMRSLGAAVEVGLRAKRSDLRVGGAAEVGDIRGDRITEDLGTARAYLRQRLQLSSTWQLGLQVGVERRRRFSAFPTFTGHLIRRLGERAWLWLGADRARRYPSSSERLWQADRYVGNPRLMPERGWTLEIGGSVASSPGNRLRVAGFFRDVEDVIGLSVADTVLLPANLGRRRVMGADFDARLRLWRRTAVGAVAQWLHELDPDPAKQMNLPEATVTGYAEAAQTFFHDLDVKGRVFARVLGGRWSTAFEGPDLRPVTVRLARDFFVDGMLILHFKDVQFFFSLEDIFDRQAVEVWGYPQIGRNFRWGINWRFFD